ncbi:MAG: glycosyltransferase family 4 protein [Bacteroidetes bacterium]|nr:MAG: glycosyltransferase family 4 protein [Bacteroidota bacterium]
MNLLVLNWQDLSHPLAGGAEVHLHETYSRIAAMGHRVTLFCSSYDGAKPAEEMNGITVLREGGRFLFNYVAMRRYLTDFRHRKFDAVVDDVNKVPFCAPAYVKEPVLGEIHHLLGTSVFKEAFFPLASYVYLAERASLPMYRKVHFMVHSPSTHAELLANGFAPERVHHVHYGVNHGLFRRTGVAKSATPLVGALGRLKKYKSFDHLIEAFAIVKREMPDARLEIVGDGDDRPRLEQLTRTLGLTESVAFAGFVSEQEKVDRLNRMHVAVNTSAKEGWGLTATEANACGTTTVSSNVQGLRDAVVDGETGLLYEYGDREQLAEKVLLLLRDANLRERLERQALVRSKEFDWQTGAERTMEVLERIVHERRRSA